MVKYIVINHHYEGGGIVAQFDTETELDAWLAENKPSPVSYESFLVIRGEVLREIKG